MKTTTLRSAFRAGMACLILGSALSLDSCKKKDESPSEPTPTPTPTVPVTPTNTAIPGVTTLSVSNVNDTSAVCGGNVTREGATVITAVGVCWDEQPAPTLLKSRSIDGAGVGTYSSKITGLKPNTKYYVRAYATNLTGTAYGEEVSFTTAAPSIWSVWTGGVPANTQIRAFATIGSDIFAAGNGGVLKSTGGQNNWAYANSGLTDLSVTSLAVSGSALFAGTGNGGVFYSTDGGATWTARNNGIAGGPSISVRGIAVTSDGNLFMSNNSNIYWSADNGNIWTNVSPAGVSSIIMLTAAGSNVYAFDFMSSKVYISGNNGNSWTSMPALASQFINAMKATGSSLFVSTMDGNTYMTNNNSSWTNIKNGLPAIGNKNVYALEAAGNTIYAGMLGAVYASTDNGSSWGKVGSGLPGSTNINVLCRTSTSLFAGSVSANPNGIFKLDL